MPCSFPNLNKIQVKTKQKKFIICNRQTGEALVGNEAVDQLTRFNQALLDHSSVQNPHTIDGIVLTKFDTIDSKVGLFVQLCFICNMVLILLNVLVCQFFALNGMLFYYFSLNYLKIT